MVRGATIDGRPDGGFWEDFGGLTALHIAVWAARSKMVAFLLEEGANPTLTDKNFNAPPIGWAIHLNRETNRVHLQEAMQK